MLKKFLIQTALSCILVASTHADDTDTYTQSENDYKTIFIGSNTNMQLPLLNFSENATPIPVPQSTDKSSIVTPIPIPQSTDKSSTVTPIPIPQSTDKSSTVTPIPIPQSTDKSSIVTPIPIPQSTDKSSIVTPIPVPQSTDKSSTVTPIPVPQSTDNSSTVTPIPVPQSTDNSSTVAPIPIPQSTDNSSTVTPIPIPQSTDKSSIVTPIPVPQSTDKNSTVAPIPIPQSTDKSSTVTPIPVPQSTDKKEQQDIIQNSQNSITEEEIIIEEVILDSEIHNRPIYDHKNVILSPNVSKKNYSENNRHLPKVFYQSEYTSLLFDAVKNNDIQGIKSLIQKGGNINAQDVSNGYTLVMHAIQCNKIKALRAIILNGADLKKTNSQGQTALHVATSLGNAQAIEVLMAAGIDPTIKDKKGKRASDYMNSRMKNVASIMVANYQDQNKALIDFVGLSAYDAVEYALNHGAKIDIQDDISTDGDTPLIIAIKCQDIKMVSLLLTRGASLNAKNKRGKTPMQIAINNSEIMNILRTVKINRDMEGMIKGSK